MRKTICYTVMFKTIVELPDNPTQDDINDAVTDIIIPEDHSDDGSHYVEDTFEVDCDTEGNPILYSA